MHIMWYESAMIPETFDSIKLALDTFVGDVKIKLCLNSQTYIEKPSEGVPEKMFEVFKDHPIMKIAEITYKTDNDEFYNIGDWRRDVYDPSSKYTVWGESDCLLPYDFFCILNEFNAPENPSLLTFSSRKMWDDSWTCVEHSDLRKVLWKNGDVKPHIPKGLMLNEQIDQKFLDEYNDRFEQILIEKLPVVKIDGALLSISGGINEKFIPSDMHFAREDTCASYFFAYKRIPQYHVATRIKGHNYNHTSKRTNTLATRKDDVYKKYESDSSNAMMRFVRSFK